MLSLVIPTFNAAEELPACIEQVRDGADEIVVVDGGSEDATPAVAAEAGARLILAPKGRGGQLRAGAGAAQGDWLLFLHADTRLGPNWRAAAEAHMARHPGKAACFRFRLRDEAWQARLIERAVAARVRLFGLPYGDQGLLAPRWLYEAAGGYRPMPLMEDVDLVRRIGRKRLRLLRADAFTSAARWRRDGWLRRSAINMKCLALYLSGMPPERIGPIYER